MLDTYRIQSGPNRVSVETHEHRAPTDESVRILRDMERRAEERLIDRGRLENNILQGEWVILKDHLRMEDKALCAFILNGKEISFEMPIERPWRRTEAEARKIGEAMIERVATEIVGQAVVTPEFLGNLIK